MAGRTESSSVGDTPRYLPHRDLAGVLHMGLVRLDPRQWIETDADIGRQYRAKCALAEAQFAAVYGEADLDETAAEELLAMLSQHLLRDHPAHYREEAGELYCLSGNFSVLPTDGPPLWRASLLVADDLAIMVPRGEAYVLAAASLCSPSHWRLADKLGRPMREIHDPIPGVHETLSARIDRFLSHLRVEAPVQRCNWSLQYGDARFCPSRGSRDDAQPLHYRIERQTLRRLPVSGAIVFTIRVYLHPVSVLRKVPGALPLLLQAVRETPEALAQYKGFPSYLPALEALVAEAD